MPVRSSTPCGARPRPAATVSPSSASSSSRLTSIRRCICASCWSPNLPSRRCRRRLLGQWSPRPKRPIWSWPRPPAPPSRPCTRFARGRIPPRFPSWSSPGAITCSIRRSTSAPEPTISCRSPFNPLSCARGSAPGCSAGARKAIHTIQGVAMALQSVNPTTEDVLETFEEFSDAQVDAALQQAHDAQQQWRETSFGERASRLQAAARILRGQKGRWATLATSEMGKPLVEAEAEIDKCAWNCDYYAQHAATFLADEHIETEASESFVAFEPLGVVLAIMPWNFPFWQVFRFAAPALMAGNG